MSIETKKDQSPIWKVFQSLTFQATGNHLWIDFDEPIKPIFEASFLIKSGEGEDKVAEFETALNEGRGVEIEFFSPRGLTMRALIVAVECTPNDPAFEILHGYAADQVTVSVVLDQNQLWAMTPISGEFESGY